MDWDWDNVGLAELEVPLALWEGDYGAAAERWLPGFLLLLVIIMHGFDLIKGKTVPRFLALSNNL